MNVMYEKNILLYLISSFYRHISSIIILLAKTFNEYIDREKSEVFNDISRYIRIIKSSIA